jgi:hypothetical protein
LQGGIEHNPPSRAGFSDFSLLQRPGYTNGGDCGILCNNAMQQQVWQSFLHYEILD